MNTHNHKHGRIGSLFEMKQPTCILKGDVSRLYSTLSVKRSFNVNSVDANACIRMIFSCAENNCQVKQWWWCHSRFDLRTNRIRVLCICFFYKRKKYVFSLLHHFVGFSLKSLNILTIVN